MFWIIEAGYIYFYFILIDLVWQEGLFHKFNNNDTVM